MDFFILAILTEWFYRCTAYRYNSKLVHGGGFILSRWTLCLHYMATLAEKHGWVNHGTSCRGQIFCLEMNLIQTWKACLEWLLCNNITYGHLSSALYKRILFPAAEKITFFFFFNNWPYLGFLGDSDPNSYYKWNLKVNFVTFILFN